jgi:hypothetical protein
MVAEQGTFPSPNRLGEGDDVTDCDAGFRGDGSALVRPNPGQTGLMTHLDQAQIPLSRDS